MTQLNRASELLETNKSSHLTGFCAVLLTLAEVSQAVDDIDAAMDLFRRVLEELDGVQPQSEQHADALNLLTSKGFLGLGGATARSGEAARAKDLLARAVEFSEAAYGHGHPEMVSALTEVAAIYRVLGDEDAAKAIDEELAVAERMLREAEQSALDIN